MRPTRAASRRKGGFGFEARELSRKDAHSLDDNSMAIRKHTVLTSGMCMRRSGAADSLIARVLIFGVPATPFINRDFRTTVSP